MGVNQSFNLGNFGDYAGYSSGYQFDPEKHKAFSGMWSKLGKENESSPSKSDSKPDWGKALNVATSYLGKAREKRERDEILSKLPYALGRGTGPYGGEIFDGFGFTQPSQHAPIVVPGVQQSGGRGGLFGEIGGLAGAAGTAAGVFGPLGMPIGAGIGGMIDRFV